MEKNIDKNIVIVGGGLAGLSAAYELLKGDGGNIIVTVIEALDRVGGRIHTPTIDDEPVDVGAFMIFPFYQELRSLLNEFDLGKKLKPIGNKEFFRFFGN